MRNLWLRNNTTIAIHRFRTGIDDTRIRGRIIKTGIYWLWTTITAHRWHFSKTGIHWLWTTITAHRWNLSKTCIPTTAHRWRNLWLIEGIIIFGGLWMVSFKCFWKIHWNITICNWHRQIHHWLISYSSHGFLTLTLHHLLWGKLFQLFLYQCCRLF